MSLRVHSRLCLSELQGKMTFLTFPSVDFWSMYLKTFTNTYLGARLWEDKTAQHHIEDLLLIFWLNELHALWQSFGTVLLNGLQNYCVWLMFENNHFILQYVHLHCTYLRKYLVI